MAFRLRLPLLIFALSILLALHPVGGRASAVGSVYGPVVYTWSDALPAALAKGVVHAATIRPVETEFSTVYAGILGTGWVPNADAERCSPGAEKRAEGVFADLTRLGVPVGALAGLKVYALPACSLRFPGGSLGAVGASYGGENSVLMAGLCWDMERVLVHELGHYLSERYLGVRGYDWIGASGKGREYLRLRGYSAERPLDLWG